MKPGTIHRPLAGFASRGRHAGFTLPEMMVTLAIFSMVVIGVVSVNMFGLRMVELTEPKMLADAQARRLLARFAQDVREADAVFVLQGETITNQGSSLRLEQWSYVQNDANGEMTIVTNLIITYEFESALMELMRYETDNGGDGRVESMAEGVNNPPDHPVFRRESSGWAVSSREDPDLVDDPLHSPAIIALHLIFSRLYPTDYPVGPEHYYRDYQLRSKVAFRSH